jgi:hypothetical protein
MAERENFVPSGLLSGHWDFGSYDIRLIDIRVNLYFYQDPFSMVPEKLQLANVPRDILPKGLKKLTHVFCIKP